MTLEQLDWNSYFAEKYEECKKKDSFAGRIFKEQKNLFWVYTETGEKKARSQQRVQG